MKHRRESNLENIRRQFKKWRAEKRSKRARIPEELWQSAVKLTPDYSIHRVSRVLHLNHTALKQRALSAGSKNELKKEAGCTFIEVDVEKASTAECIVELEDGTGAKMKMHLKEATAGHVFAACGAFWQESR